MIGVIGGLITSGVTLSAGDAFAWTCGILAGPFCYTGLGLKRARGGLGALPVRVPAHAQL